MLSNSTWTPDLQPTTRLQRHHQHRFFVEEHKGFIFDFKEITNIFRMSKHDTKAVNLGRPHLISHEEGFMDGALVQTPTETT